MGSAWTLARTSFAHVTRLPVYYVLLIALGLLIYLSPALTLFEFARSEEQKMVREMGLASLTLWGFLVVLITSPMIVTTELEDRTALTLLSKPISRSAFLIGKFFGVCMALAIGIAFLGLVLFLTRWSSVGIKLLEGREFEDWVVTQGAWSFFKEKFLIPEGKILLAGATLCFLQVAILAVFGITLAAFTPPTVCLALTSLVFLLGNISAYMLSSSSEISNPILVFTTRALYYVFPNFGYLNLQEAFSEGRPIRCGYVLRAGGYTALYCACVLGLACEVFSRREIR